MSAVPNVTTLPAWPRAERSDVAGPMPRRWTLTRNCSLSPHQVGVAYGLLCAVSLSVAVGFLLAGFGIVLLFCGLELMAVGVAWLMWGRRVGQGDIVGLEGDLLVVDMRRGSTLTHLEWPSKWTRVIEDGAHVLLACGARRVEVGTQVTLARRQRFARELRRALATPLHAPN